MSYLTLIGSGGWTQRWEIVGGEEAAVAEALHRIGSTEISALPVLDPNTRTAVTFVVAWQAVAAGFLTPSPSDHAAPGQYA